MVRSCFLITLIKYFKSYSRYESFWKIWKFAENLPKIWKSSKNLKIFQTFENLPKIWKSSKNLKIFQKSVWSQVSRIALCMSKVKVLWLSQWQDHLLSCSGQLKMYQVFDVFGVFNVFVLSKKCSLCLTCLWVSEFFSRKKSCVSRVWELFCPENVPCVWHVYVFGNFSLQKLAMCLTCLVCLDFFLITNSACVWCV